MDVNDEFEGFPIDYFSFTRNDFQTSEEGSPEYVFRRNVLELHDGYITSDLSYKLDFNERDTTVINCAVGQGKTYAILHSIKEFLSTEESLGTFFIIAVPLVSLITQYKKDLLDMGFTEDQIFNYEDISDVAPVSGESYKSISCKIHLVTVNTLLGNPGEHAIVQSERKYQYIYDFAKELSENFMKLIIVYDEIHEAIRNFSETGIAYLSHFSSVLWKNIVISATYNVQSIPVIKLLSSQTGNRILLLESERTVCREQSKLYLHYLNNYSSKKFKEINNLIDNFLDEGKKIDVLGYSKDLCDSNFEKLKKSHPEISNRLKLCVSNIQNNQGDHDIDLNVNRYDNEFYNIGTNFKSGVNIIKDNHALVIILPPASSRGTYANLNGIFSEGPNSIIQAIARQRTPGEIHIVLPKPLEMDYSTLPDSMNESQKNVFSEKFNEVSRPSESVHTTNNVQVERTKYIPFEKHREEVERWWNILLERYEMPKRLNPEIKLPTYDNFVIENGEKCTTRTNFLGRDLSCFVTYSAFTNQFYNAKLEEISFPQRVGTLEDFENQIEEAYIHLESENISSKFNELFNMFDFTGLSQSEQRSAWQQVFNYVVDKEENISDLEDVVSNKAYRFIISYFNRFIDENPSRLHNRLLEFRELAQLNEISYNGKTFYKIYNENNRIFRNMAEDIRSVISELKSIYPLSNDSANFFDNYASSTDMQLEKKFYNFILKTRFVVKRRQTTINNASGSYYEVLNEI